MPNLCCFGDALAEDFDFDVSQRGVECDRHGGERLVDGGVKL